MSKKCGGGGAGKAAAGAAAVVSKFTKSTINWKEMRDKVPSNQLTQFLVFKTKSDNYLRRVQATPPTPPKIDWEYYKKIVPVDGLVDKFKTEYEGYKVPYPEDTLTKSIDTQWEKIKEEIKKFKADQSKHIEAANKEISRIQAIPDYEDMTMEMFCTLYPSQAPNFVDKPTFWPHDDDDWDVYKPTK